MYVCIHTYVYTYLCTWSMLPLNATYIAYTYIRIYIHFMHVHMHKHMCLHKQISAKTSELSKHHVELHETLKRRKKETDHCLDVQRFKREAEQAEQWIAMREQLLNSEDFGVSECTLIICTYFRLWCTYLLTVYREALKSLNM